MTHLALHALELVAQTAAATAHAAVRTKRWLRERERPTFCGCGCGVVVE